MPVLGKIALAPPTCWVVQCNQKLMEQVRTNVCGHCEMDPLFIYKKHSDLAWYEQYLRDEECIGKNAPTACCKYSWMLGEKHKNRFSLHRRKFGFPCLLSKTKSTSVSGQFYCKSVCLKSHKSQRLQSIALHSAGWLQLCVLLSNSL